MMIAYAPSQGAANDQLAIMAKLSPIVVLRRYDLMIWGTSCTLG